MRPCAVLDLDGTLIDSLPTCVEILNEMLSDRGAAARVSSAGVRRHISQGGVAMVSALLGGACGDPLAAIGEFRERYAAKPVSPQILYPGVRDGLVVLSARGVGLAIHSNKPQALCETILMGLGLSTLFDSVIGSHPTRPSKPDPGGFHRALEAAGGAHARSCYVGDSEIDHETARRARVPFLLLTYGYAHPDHDFTGALRADRFADGVTMIESLLGVGQTVRGSACGRAA